MSILDRPQDTLAKDLFLPDKSLRASVRSAILHRLKDYLPLAAVNDLLLLGSITSYQYSANSDVDVNVTLKPGLEVYRDKLHLKFKKLNAQNFTLPGGRVLTFFVNAYNHSRRPDGNSDYPYAVYDILADEWLTPPKKLTKRLPEDEFAEELLYAKLIADGIYNTINVLYRQLIKPIPSRQALETRARQIESTLQRLQEEYSSIDRARKTTYSLNWGIPRKSQENIIYKYIEYSGIKKLLDILHDEKLTTIH